MPPSSFLPSHPFFSFSSASLSHFSSSPSSHPHFSSSSSSLTLFLSATLSPRYFPQVTVRSHSVLSREPHLQEFLNTLEEMSIVITDHSSKGLGHSDTVTLPLASRLTTALNLYAVAASSLPSLLLACSGIFTLNDRTKYPYS